MTLSNTKVKVTYLGNGQNRRFDVPFAVLDTADLAVFITGPDGELKRVESGFSVSADKTFVTYPQNADKPALQKDFKITIMRQTPATQENDLIQQAVLHKESLETSLDKLTMIAQEVQERLSRAVTVGPDENADGVSAAELVQQMRELYAQIKTEAQNASEEAQKAIAAAVEAYEQAEKLYSNVEYYTAGTAALDYTGDLQTFKLYGSYKADGMTLKVFVNGLLKRMGANYDYTEIINPELENKGDNYGDTVHFNSALTTGDSVVFMWGDTLTMPGGEVAQAAALSAETAEAQAQAAAASAAEAKESAESFIPKSVGALEYSQSNLSSDNPGAVPGWTGQIITTVSQKWPALLAFVKAHPELQKTEAQYTQILSQYGRVHYYVLNETADTLRLPVYYDIHQVVEKAGFGAFETVGSSGTADDDGFLLCYGANNTTISISVGGTVYQFVSKRDKYGQGPCSAICPVQKGKNWSISGGNSNWFMPVNTVKASAGVGTSFPWIVAANCVPDIIKHAGGIYSTEDLIEALAARPTRTQTDGLYAPKSTTYSKTEVDGKIATAVEPLAVKAQTYTKTETDSAVQTALMPYAKTADTYTTAETDEAIADAINDLKKDEDFGFKCIIRDWSENSQGGGDDNTGGGDDDKPGIAAAERKFYISQSYNSKFITFEKDDSSGIYYINYSDASAIGTGYFFIDEEVLNGTEYTAGRTFGGLNTDYNELELDEKYYLHYNANNLKLPAGSFDHIEFYPGTDNSSVTGAYIKVSTSSTIGEDDSSEAYYLVGDVNAWNENQNYKMTKGSDGKYHLKNIQVAGGFKIKKQGDWNQSFGGPVQSGAYDLETEYGGTIPSGYTYSLQYMTNNGSNLYLENSYTISDFAFYLDENNQGFFEIHFA